MDRTQLLEVLKSGGLLEEAANKIIESLEQHLTLHKTKLEESYRKKTEQAKQIVIQETRRWKANAAKKLGIFLESKVKHVENQVSRQTGLNESNAVAELAKIKSVLAGAPANSSGLQKKITALEEEITKSKKVITNLNEQYSKLSTVATTAVKSAKKAEAALVESQNKLKEAEKLIAEGKNLNPPKKSEPLSGSVLNEDNERKPKPAPKKNKNEQAADPEVNRVAEMV